MKIYAPDYYLDFHCIADKCRHSCCIGWDVYIDDDTLERYSRLMGELKNRIEKNLHYTEDGVCFRMKEDGKCPFLNTQGLCDIIIERGKGYLSEICSEHPRFYNFFSQFTEMGIGLSCEEAARIILSQEKEMTLVEISCDDLDEWKLTDEEKNILKKRNDILSILQNQKTGLEEKVKDIIRKHGISLPKKDPTELSSFFFQLERLDKKWDLCLEDLATLGNFNPIPELEIPLKNLLVYFIYRHVSSAKDENDLRARVFFSIISFDVIRALCNAEISKNSNCSFEHLCELARMYSAEIEYSTENTEKIIYSYNK